MLVSDHSSNSSDGEEEDPDIPEKENEQSKKSNNLSNGSTEFHGILHQSSVDIAPKVLQDFNQLETSYINPEETELMEEISGTKASESSPETSESSP